MVYGSVCSGIEAATVAWHPLGWQAAFYSEIDAFPCAVLKQYYPDVPNHGDMTKFKEWPNAAIDLLVGGTPCQSFSVAGLRNGLDDPRGNLTLVYLAVADKYRPRWLVWENVPGVLSYGTGAFGAFLGGLGELGYGFAYRVLDAQYCGVPQRRRRVFVVGYLGDWRRAAAVLFEFSSLRGDLAPSRQPRQGVAPTIAARTRGGGGLGTDFDCDGGLIPSTGDVSHCLNAGGMGRQDYETETLIAHSLRADGYDASEDGTGRGTPIVHVDVMPTMMNGANTPAGHNARSGHSKDNYIVPVAFHNRQDPDISGDVTHPLGAQDNGMAVAFRVHGEHSTAMTGGGDARVADPVDVARSLDTCGGYATNQGGNIALQRMQVRRLTPRECERLQGFPDDYTLIPYNRKPAKDGPRYKALGNSMAVPVMRWIGERIAAVEAIPNEQYGDGDT